MYRIEHATRKVESPINLPVHFINRTLTKGRLEMTRDEALDLFYHKKNGDLVWNNPCNPRRTKKWDIAGRLCKEGPRLVTVRGKKYSVTNIIWLMHYGYYPKHQIMHIDGNKDNNRIENLVEKKKRKIEKLTYKFVRELFNYKDGKLYWKNPISFNVKKGSIAGWLGKDGYYRVEIQGKINLLHRMIFLWHYGYMPENDIDHINKNKSDNRIENLREVSRQCNTRNTGNNKRNTSSVKGVHLVKSSNMWHARITINKKRYVLGTFREFNEAVLHRLAIEQCLNWNKCDADSPAYQYAVKHNLIKEKKPYGSSIIQNWNVKSS